MVNSKKFHVLFFFLTVFSILTSSNFVKVNAQIPNEANSEFFMGIQILESDQQAILDSIEKVKELNLGNMVVLHPLDQAWNLSLIEEAIRIANDLNLYIIFEAYNFSDHDIRIEPQQFLTWQNRYPKLLGILVQEISGKQIDLNLWISNSTEVKSKLKPKKQ